MYQRQAYNSLYEWQEIEALELGNKKIDELRKEINNINIQMIKFSLLGETILEWNDKDIEHYHARRMAMDSMLCRFKATYPAERIDSVRSLLEDKERQMFQIVRLMDEQQSIYKKIALSLIHIYLDTPWRPSDLQQRDGRGVRAGNEIDKHFAGNNVDVILYAVEKLSLIHIYLLTDGHTKLLKGFKSKQGKNFDAIVAFDGDA